MPTIPNPSPIACQCGAFWIVHLSINRATIAAVAAPWDAQSGYYVGNPSAIRRVWQILQPNSQEGEATQDAAAAARTVRDALATEAARLAGSRAEDIISLDVYARDPAGACRVRCRFAGLDRPYEIPDLFVALASDAALAAAYAQVMGWLATRPELTS